MTFQSSPYFQWTFPDQAIRQNIYGVGKMETVSVPTLDYMPGHDAVHANFREYEHARALARVRNDRAKEQGMLGHRNTTERSQRYDRPASRSAIENGQFQGSPMLYAANAGAGMHGGRIYTKEGQEWLAKRLEQRAQEYEAISTENFSRGPPSQIELQPKTDVVDTLLAQLYNAFTTGVFSNQTLETANLLLSNFLSSSATLNARQLTEYARNVSTLQQSLRGYRGPSRVQSGMAVPVTIEAIRKILGDMQTVISDVIRAVNDLPETKSSIIAGLRRKFTPVGQVEEENRIRADAARAAFAAPVPAPAPAPAPAPVPAPAPAPAPGALAPAPFPPGVTDEERARFDRAIEGLGRRRRHRTRF